MSPSDNSEYFFIANGLNIYLHKLLPHIGYMLLLDLLGKLYSTNIVTVAFFYGPACSRFSQPPNVFKLIHFLARNNKNKKYENPLAPTDLFHERSRVILIG